MHRMILSVAVALSVGRPLVGQEAVPAHVPIGVTDVLAELTPVVGYQYFGQEPSSLGYGWTGFDGASGVYFVPEVADGGANQVFMHCPWRGGKGVTFADYSLRLPDVGRVLLSFEIGLRPSAKNTDGVTYRVRVGAKTVFDTHCTWKEMRAFEADLSAFAGKGVTLRLEVDPGPDQNTTDDWSLWRNVRLLAGTKEQIAAATARAQVEAAKRRAADVANGEKLGQVSLLPLTSHHSDSICPGVLVATRVSAQKRGDVYVFTCKGDETIEYLFDPAKGLLEGITVAVNGERLEPAPFRGGPRVHLDGRDFSAPTRLLKTELLKAELDGARLTCEYRYTNPETGSSARLRAVLWPEGKSLGLEVQADSPRFSGFTAKPYGGRSVDTAFAVGGPPMWRSEGVYVSTVFDLMRSDASSVGSDGVSYVPLTNGRRNDLRDRCYLTVSSRYEETLANLIHEPSPYLDELAKRVVLDVWRGGFADDEQWLKDMSRYGLDGFLIIKHVWQRDGYDRTYPDTMPANAQLGGDEALRSLSLTAQKLGHRFNVHENYYDYYPNAEDFHAEDCALDPAGNEQKGWDRGPVAAKILKPSKLMDYARRFSPEIKRRYDCNSAYHDIMPTWRVDFDANVKDAGKIRVTHQYTRELCDYDRELFGGPVVFEAASAPMAGVYDGGCNHGVDTYRTPAAVGFELLKVHPRMSNHGFGYYERWLPWGYGTGWATYVMTDRELDKYRAYQIAFGRTGFIGHQIMKHPHGIVREYYLMEAFGRAYTGRLVERLRYQMDGKWVDAGTAARYRQQDRLYVEYEGGQRVYVNLAEEPLQVERALLPQFGALTLGPRAEAWTAMRDGQICDYAQYGNVRYVDARSHVWQPPKTLPPIKPRVAELKHLGGPDFELTVNWDVGRKLDRDYLVFWHFRHNGSIEFQRDHKPSTPTSRWQVGDVFVDGPSKLSVKDDANATEYDIVVGLYDKQGRAKLIGGSDEVSIGRIVVKRDGERATSVQFAPTPSGRARSGDPEIYLEGANVKRKVIDFGPVATNGAAVIRSVEGGQEIVPVPIGQVITIGVAELPDTGNITMVNGEGKAGTVEKLANRDGRTWFETAPEAVKYIVRR